MHMSAPFANLFGSKLIASYQCSCMRNALMQSRAQE
jgi:hypothetical protein